MISEVYQAYLGSPFGFGGLSGGHMLLIIVCGLASFGVSSMLQRRFGEYSQIPIRLTGAEIARVMLEQNGIHDVQVVSTPGHLTDHYDPTTRTVNLSESVFQSNSVAAAAVAAHECGHAVQHQQAYAWLGLRSKMVPAVQLSSNLMNVILIAGIVGMTIFHTTAMLWVFVAVFGMTTLFAFITLPVEFDASRRALAWMERSGLASSIEHERAKNALFWAAMTYVVAALGSLAQLIYWISQARERR